MVRAACVAQFSTAVRVESSAVGTRGINLTKGQKENKIIVFLTVSGGSKFYNKVNEYVSSYTWGVVDFIHLKF